MTMRGDLYALFQLTRRALKIFLKDKANVFFSLLSPLIVLALYALILGRIQSDGLMETLASMGVAGGEAQVRAFCDSWMLAGAMSCACLTVPLCACGIMIGDRSRGIRADLAVSPAAAWVTPCSYFLSVVAAGLCIGAAVLAICLIWLAASGSWLLSAGDVFGCIGTLLLSVLSSATIFVFLIGFLRSQGAFTAINVILGTVIGFLIGAYMPIAYFPQAVQTFTYFLPGSYSAGLFRNFMMRGSLEQIASELSAPFAAALEREFSLTFDFFGAMVRTPAMFLVVAGSALLFAALNIAVAVLRAKRAR